MKKLGISVVLASLNLLLIGLYFLGSRTKVKWLRTVKPSPSPTNLQK